MSVIIKGMQMPSSCMECPMFNGAGCKATMKMFSELTNVAVRMKDCPLVELPEKHGRLIDADKLIISDVKDVNGDYWVVVHLGGIELLRQLLKARNEK